MAYASLTAGSGIDDHGSRPGSAASRRRHGKDAGFAGQASWISSVINLVNTIVGAGVLAMPLALSRMGILLGSFVILFAGLTAGFGLYLQTRCARYLDRGSASFFALSQITYPNAAVIFDAAIAVKCFGVGVSYLIIIGDLMPGVMRGFTSRADDIPFLVDRHFWVTAFMLVVIPLSFLRRLDSLKYTSVVALIAIAYLTVLVVAHFVAGDTMADRGPIYYVHWASAVKTLSSFPVIVFAYTCHQNMFSILNEIHNNSQFRTTSVVVFSIGSSAALYVLVAITGYLSFGDNVRDNIVGMYKPSVASTIAKAAITVLVMFSYPLQVHPCRASVDAVLKWRPRGKSQQPSPPRPNSVHSTTPLTTPTRKIEDMSDVRFAAITTAIIVFSYIVAMTVSSLSTVLAYVGSTGSTSISFILPGLFFYKISAPDSPHHQRLLKENDDEYVAHYGRGEQPDEREEAGLLGGEGGSSTKGSWLERLKKGWLRRLSLALAVYGVIVMVTCLVTNTFFLASH